MIVWVWMLLAVGGAIVHAFFAGISYGDLRRLPITAPHAARKLGRAHLRNDLLRLAIQLIFFGLGSLAIADLRGPWITWGLILAVVLLIASAVWDRVDRERVGRMRNG